MASVFSKPKIPKPVPAEPAPSPVMVDEDRLARDTQDRLRRRRGRASTILNSGPAGSVELKKALGA